MINKKNKRCVCCLFSPLFLAEKQNLFFKKNIYYAVLAPYLLSLSHFCACCASRIHFFCPSQATATRNMQWKHETATGTRNATRNGNTQREHETGTRNGNTKREHANMPTCQHGKGDAIKRKKVQYEFFFYHVIIKKLPHTHTVTTRQTFFSFHTLRKRGN